MFPLHVWLPSAHANAPSHVSAIFSGVAIKMGIYGIVRFSGWLPVPAAAGWVVMGLGATSALLGIAFALAQNDFKRLLAYCSVENIGIILIGVGARMLVASTHGDAPWGRLAVAGRSCMCGITVRSRRCCFSAPVRCCTPRARGR
jgi:hydrogenase-4 component B